MSKQQTAVLSVVPASEEPALSPARQRLVEAYSRREAASAQFADATKQYSRVENLLVDPKPIEQKIADLEAENAAFIENWALSASGAAPKLPHTMEIEKLKAELRQAEIVAKGAKAALARMYEDLQAAQAESVRAVEGIKSAADQVLLEVADEFAKMLRPIEERAALLRVALKSLQQHFLFEGARGRPVGNLSNAIAGMIPRSHEPVPQIDKIMGKWTSLASRLFTDPQSQMEL
jgi:hypothetical protein